jgi:NADH-quinone oxidoreductase subunit N
VFILVGLAFKISAVPFHMWVPDVYEGSPTSVTSFFAVVPKIAGFAVLIRFLQTPFQNIIFEWQTILIFMSIGSMILGSVAAIGQTNIKRLMAYSSIGHIGYALAGVATGTISGYSSSILYLTIYVVMNIGAFACIFLMKKEGKYMEEITDLSGISKKNPLIAISFLIILFSLAGIPPLGGFFAKFYVFVSVIESGLYTLAIIGLLTTVVSAFYYLRIIKVIYFDEIKKPFDEIKNISITSTVLLSCFLLVTFFLYPSLLSNVINSIFIN